MLDVHAHILPGMDDGSASVSESLAMLRESALQGVDVIAATPHFYAGRESPEQFLARREAAFAAMREAMQAESGLPIVRLGAETHYFEGMANAGMIGDLAIQGGRYLLVEMPFQAWTKWEIQELFALQRRRGLTPILAHVERYPVFRQERTLRELADEGIWLQMNGEALLTAFIRRRALRYLESGLVKLLGSDCHHILNRRPNLGEAMRVFRRRCGDEVVTQWLCHGNNLLGG